MFSPRLVIGFALRFLVAYGVLLALWPIVGGLYGTAFRAGGELVFGMLGSDTVVRFRAWPGKGGVVDTRLLFGSRETDEGAWTPISTRHIGYRSTALLVGLVLATPVAWRRRARSLVYGLVVLHCLVAMRLAILVWWGLSPYRPGAEEMPDSFWTEAVQAGLVLLANGHALTYTLPIVVWALVSVRREDFDTLLQAKRRPLRAAQASAGAGRA